MAGQPSRRAFLVGAGSAALLGAAPWHGAVAASIGPAPAALYAERRVIEVRGRAATVAGLRQPDGTHGLRIEASERFRVALTNRLGEPTLIHWHGLRPPLEQDGVPGPSQPLLQPGNAAYYDFLLRESGSFWMHAHHALQEQTLLAAPLIIADSGRTDEQEVVLMLHDFSFRPPEEILASLKSRAAEVTKALMAVGSEGGHSAHGAASHGASAHGASAHGGSAHGTASHGHGETAHEQAMHGGAHVNDVEFDAYLANDRTLADPELVQVERRGRVRLRIINGASSTNFQVDLGALEGELIAVDGRAVRPVKGRRFGIAMSQRLDLRLDIRDAGAFPILALREGDRQATGIVLHTPGAAIRRLSETVHEPAPALGFAEEERLSATAALPARPADRSLTIALTGDMTVYGWGLDGSEGASGMREYPVGAGERVEITFDNRTNMSHPMHLHGHRFQVVGSNGRRFSGAMRDTVLVAERATVTIALDADNPGSWMLHCHNLYHQSTGMMALLRYV
jgi:FtsP/CotA-like multicopper oxidase with cupredoxin domain